MDRDMTQIVYCYQSFLLRYSVPNTVTSICTGAFTGCYKLRTITLLIQLNASGRKHFATAMIWNR